MISEQDRKNANILIVDDQRLHVRLLESILTAEGYSNITSTTNPLEAINLVFKIKPDIMLLDLKMPQMDGIHVMKKIEAEREKDYLPILVFTADKGQETRMQAFHAGANDFVTVPYENIEVIVRVRNLVDTRLLHKQLQQQNSLLEEKVKERTKELRDTRLDIIQRLARAAEYRDNDTGTHILRMSYYCAALAKAAGLTESQCELLLNASPLHDVGKIGIPDTILLKPGKLTEEEFEIMKTHTTIGAELLSGSDSPLMKMAQTIALTHQEKWDGSGYPNKLKGEEIPLVGRICGLCDVFDALTSARPYKRAWSFEEAVEEIRKQNGKMFDPRLAEKFLEILPEIRKIHMTYKDS